ncbi:hypothetical protein FN846DRAFT_886872 [Sphaerosporella brunnea]|uniref:Uncharacterized protein n=1 Tax=Sphaerosporella brunnea TaxID=1250544 RepID=A0A5J5F7K5_9PEZI|nr:hypothetical protein FN846DRAFT_886872 [Sphaerosporella brunnea]
MHILQQSHPEIPQPRRNPTLTTSRRLPREHRPPLFTVNMFRAPYAPRSRSRPQPAGPVPQLSNPNPPPPLSGPQVHFTRSTLAREAAKEAATEPRRSFAEYWERYVQRDPALRKRHLQCGDESRRRRRRHSIPEQEQQWPESCYYLGSDTEEPLFLRPETSRVGSRLRKTPERARHEFIDAHGPVHAAAAASWGYEYSDPRPPTLPHGKALRRVKGFWRF